jgi:hypothetical protein
LARPISVQLYFSGTYWVLCCDVMVVVSFVADG